MIYGIGIDIIEINRINTLLLNYRNRFVNRILNFKELEKYKKNNQPSRFLAKRFAVKEAALKAFGTGVSHKLSFNQFELFNNALGKPKLRLFTQAANLAKQLNIINIHVSLSDERQYAYATVILEY